MRVSGLPKVPVSIALLLNYLFVHIAPVSTAYAEDSLLVPAYSIVISEVMWMGTDLSTADEWIEIAAFSDEGHVSASLSGWTLMSVKDDVEQPLVRFASGAHIPIGGFAVISNYPESQSRLLAAPFATSTSMSLPNTKLLLRLYDDIGVLRDEVDDGVGNPFAGISTSTKKASMERIGLHMPGNIAANWKSASASVGFDTVPFALFGTPGSGFSTPAANSSIATSSASSPSSASALSSIASLVSSESSSSSTSTVPQLRINEVMPNPVGSDDFEWMEIINVGSGSISTEGMTVSMSGSTSYALPVVQLEPHVPRLFLKAESKLSLTNAGGNIVLKQGNIILDTLAYPSVPEGVSFGRGSDGIPKALCAPTPGEINSASGSIVAIDIQSGMPTGESVTLNLALRSISGSIEGAACRWEYPDGYVNEGCNPPSHALQSLGAGEIILQFTDYCGNTMVQSLPVFVSRKPKKLQEDATNSILPFSCMPSAFTGALITEVLPNPDGDEEKGEWIEVRNVSGRDLPLCGWSIEDASGTRFDLRRLRLPLDETMVFPREQTKIALNNDKDYVRLIAPDPLGGSGIVLQEVTFDRAPAMQTYALRDDEQWLWTSILTPGSANTFPSVPLPSGPPKARLSAILPNPYGADGDSEWIEIENLTGRPLWMQKWTLRSGTDVSLSGNAIHPYAKRRFQAADLGLTFRNATGAVQLFDEAGVELSILAWDKPKEHQVVMPTDYVHRVLVTSAEVLPSSMFYIQTEDGDLPSFYPIGIRKYENNNCNDLILALIKNKKLELHFNTEIEESALFVDGYDIAPILLKNGCAYASHLLDRGYGQHEADGFMNKRGLWASDAIAGIVREQQRQEDLLRVVQSDGIRIESSIEEDLVQSGSILTFASNLPASIYVSLNDAPYALMETGAIIRSDTIVQAYAELLIGSGAIVRSDVLEKEFIIRRSEYPTQSLLSEIYPSPKKGESEWVELYNGSLQTIHLAGWMIDDVSGSGSTPILLTSQHRLLPTSFLVLKGLKVSWNNGGDDVRLIAPDGTVVDSISFPKTKTGFSYARSAAGWCLTEKPTDQSGNICFISPKKLKIRNSRSALIKSKNKASESRKILYKNIVQKGEYSIGVSPFFRGLMDARLSAINHDISLNRYLYALLALYCGFIAFFGLLRRY